MLKPPGILARVKLTPEAQRILAEKGAKKAVAQLAEYEREGFADRAIPKWLRDELTVTQVASAPSGEVYLRLERPFEHMDRYGRHVCELTTAVLVRLEHIEVAE